MGGKFRFRDLCHMPMLSLSRCRLRSSVRSACRGWELVVPSILCPAGRCRTPSPPRPVSSFDDGYLTNYIHTHTALSRPSSSSGTALPRSASPARPPVLEICLSNERKKDRKKERKKEGKKERKKARGTTGSPGHDFRTKKNNRDNETEIEFSAPSNTRPSASPASGFSALFFF